MSTGGMEVPEALGETQLTEAAALGSGKVFEHNITTIIITRPKLPQ